MIDKNGNEMKRTKAVSTRTGLIFYSKDNKEWQIDFPEDSDEGGRSYRYGGNTTCEKIAMFFLALSMGHDIDRAHDIAFHETKIRGKYVESTTEN